MNTEAIGKLVTAFRSASKVSEKLEEAFGTSLDDLYEIHGNILDVLRDFAFDSGDMKNSDVLKMLKSDMPSTEVADCISARRYRIMYSKSPVIAQPSPKIFSDEQVEKMKRTSGGYVHDAG